MEAHRLTPMVDNYSVSTFNTLYSKTENLRKKLVSEIDHHRFGLQPEDILSWFDDKFIYVFNKYHHHNEEVLLGHLINALRLFKCRVLRGAYTKKFSQKIINIEDSNTISDLFIADETTPNFYYNKLVTFLKSEISDNALYLLELTLNPPPYILHRMNSGDDRKLDKISDDLILDYFDIPNNKKTLRYVAGLREEIKIGLDKAKSIFKAS